MLTVDRRLLIFKLKEIHFADYPYDISGCDVVHFVSCRNKLAAEGFTCEESLTSVLNLTQNLDAIWMNNFAKRCRYKIRQAQRHKVNCIVNKCYEEFYRMSQSFERKRGIAPPYGIGAIKLETIKQYGTLFISKYKGETLSGYVYLEDENSIKAWIGASKRLEVDKETTALIGYANRLLHWEAIKYAKEKGIKKFDLGGLWSVEEASRDEQKSGINRFKLGFGGEMVPCYSYYKVNSKGYKLAARLFHTVSRIRKK